MGEKGSWEWGPGRKGSRERKTVRCPGGNSEEGSGTRPGAAATGCLKGRRGERRLPSARGREGGGDASQKCGAMPSASSRAWGGVAAALSVWRRECGWQSHGSPAPGVRCLTSPLAIAMGAGGSPLGEAPGEWTAALTQKWRFSGWEGRGGSVRGLEVVPRPEGRVIHVQLNRHRTRSRASGLRGVLRQSAVSLDSH